MRRLILLSSAFLMGCGTADYCLLLDGTEQMLVVSPPEQPTNDTTNPRAYRTIQDALDAVRGVPTTVCLAPGVYRENITVWGSTVLAGSGRSRTLLRPERPRAGRSPVTIDETLLTLAPPEGQQAEVVGLDLGGAAVCAEIIGAGRSTLTDVGLDNCGIGLRAHGSGPVDLIRTHVQGNRRVGLDLRDVGSVRVVGPTDLAFNGRPDLLDDELEEGVISARLDGVDRSGAVVARRVPDLSISGLRIEADRYGDAQISLLGSTGTVRDVVLDLRGLGELGDGAALHVSGGELLLQGVIARTQGQPLLTTGTAAPTLILDSVAWASSLPLTDGQTNATVGPALVLGAADIDARHLTLQGSGVSAIRAIPETTLRVRNSIIWGFSTALTGEPGGLGFGWTLTDDAELDGTELMLGEDPLLLTEGTVPGVAEDSPARCAGSPGVSAPLDAIGNPRPFESGKSPDLGAIELQQPCPAGSR
jgi:hypothetical protein